MMFILLLFVNYVTVINGQEYLGDFLGQLTGSPDIAGDVYIANMSAIIIDNFRMTTFGKLRFSFQGRDRINLPSYRWNKRGDVLNRLYHQAENILPTSDIRVVIDAPRELTNFQTFGIFDEANQVFVSSISLRISNPPSWYNTGASLSTIEYDVQGSPIVILDRRTIGIVGFNFRGSGGPPDAYIIAGTSLPIGANNGVKGYVQNYHSKPFSNRNEPFPIRRNFQRQDVIVTLPPGSDTRFITWISVFCEAYSIDFGHATFPSVSSQRHKLTPYIPSRGN